MLGDVKCEVEALNFTSVFVFDFEDYYLPQLGLKRPSLLSDPGDHHPQLLHRAPVLRDARLPHPESLPQITNLDMQVNISNFSSGTG